MITAKTYRALKLLEHTQRFDKVMTAHDFALAFWGNDADKEYLFTAVSNSGNGACSGKKAWLCAGSYLSALYKRGLTRWRPRCDYHPTGYEITKAGMQAIKEYELQNNIHDG